MSLPAKPLSREEKLALVARLAREKAARPKKAPLSFAQQRHYFLGKLDPESFAHNIFRAFALEGDFDPRAFEAAAADLLRRHESLRTTFAEEDGNVSQLVAPAAAADDFKLEVEDLRAEASPAEAAMAKAGEEARTPFDLGGQPPLRLRLLQLGEKSWVFLLSLHHIVADGWSLGILLRELFAAYAARAKGEAPSWGPLPIGFSDFALWQHEKLDLAAQIDFWKKALDGAPQVLELATDLPRPALASLAGDHAPVAMDAEQGQALRELARAHGATPFMVLLAAFAVWLHRTTGQRDLLLGTPVAGRNRQEIEGLIGSFANTLVLRSRYDGRLSFAEHLAQVRGHALAAFDHQDLPFERLVEELQPQRDLSRNPLFQVMFALLDGGRPSGAAASGSGDAVPGLEVRPFGVARGLSKVDLTLELADFGDRFGGHLEYATELYQRASIEKFVAGFERFCRQLVASPQQPLESLDLLSAEEHRQLESWNETAASFDLETPLPAAILARAAANPAATAVIEARPHAAAGASGEPRALSYGELAAASARLATRLRGQGVRRGDRVGICLERSLEAMVALLAVWRAGAAYVPLDPGHPAERLAYVTSDSGMALLLTQERLRSRLPETEVAVLAIDGVLAETGGAEFADAPIGGDDVAYLIYTSGSTGRPKGVLVPHRGLENHALAIAGKYELTAADRVLQFASLSFDLAGEEIYPTWLTGATLVLRSEEQSLAFADFLRLLADQGITVANLPTPYWHEWVLELEEGRHLPPPDLRLVVVGTEQTLAERLAGWLRACPSRPRWINSYGPSEATITATSWDPPAGEAGRVAIGRPIEGVRAHVLDAAQQPLPPGLPGELCLSGAGIAHGYHRRPALTAEKFVPDPYSKVPGSRLYRSGDRVRFLPDGAIELLGRLDDQVKVRGFRIEVGEIEAILAEHPEVKDNVVLAREAEAGDRRLVAYVAGTPGSETSLRRHLEERLPSYMVPSAILLLPALPMNRSGKVDRDALRALPLEGLQLDEAPWEAPRDHVEEVVAEVWSGLLGGRRVGIHDDFFQLGGHSLLATRMLSRLRAVFGVELPLKAIFEAPRLADLAARVAAARSAGQPDPAPPLVPAERPAAGEGLPLSFAQQRMWFLSQLDPEGVAYNMPNAFRLEGELDADALERAISEILRRHESLRTTYVSSQGKPRQVIHPPAPYLLPRSDAASEEEAHQKASALSRRPFDLENDYPLRLELIRLCSDLHWLALVFHHIASDGWSTDLFLHELQVLYRAFAAAAGAGQPSPLPELPLQYADYAVWQNAAQSGERLDGQLEFWKKRLAGAPSVLELPTNRARPPVQRHRGGRVPLRASAELGEKLRELGRREGCTQFMTLLAAWSIFLSRISHQRDIVVGTPVAGRHRPEIERLIGFFANTLVLRLELDGRPSFKEALGRSRRMVLDAYDHQDLPFERLVDEIAPQRASSHNSLFQVTFVLHHASSFQEAAPTGAEGGLRFSLPSVDNQTARFDLALSLVEQGGGYRGFLEYDADLFEPATVEHFARCFETLLASLASEPSRPVFDLDIIPADQLPRILKPWPDLVQVDPDGLPTIHEMFLRAARKFPDRPALTCEGVTLTYSQLEQKSAALARALRARGVGPESRVGLAIDRSLELLIAILGILRADGAYVPIDPASPTDRMAYVLEDSGSQLLLSRQGIELPECGSPRLDIDEIDLDEPGEAPESVIGGANLAYVIYTSGSTGRPKGVACSHGNAVRLFSATEGWYTFNENDVWTLFHSSAFDFSVWEMWGALFYGGRLVVVTYFVTRSVEHYYELLVNEGVTFLNMTPSMFRQVDRVDEERQRATGSSPLTTLRFVIFGGEAVDLQGLAGWWRRHGDVTPQLINAYGITETTVAGAYRPLDLKVLEMSVASVIGRPFPDLEYYLGDREMNLVPLGVQGEILVGGAGITRGYLGRPSLTAQRFVPNPFGGRPGERLYHSGDLGRLIETHLGLEMDYHGRMDLQVKIRGFRIELGEIETSLTELESVHEAIVLAREDDPGDKRLVAYVTLTREAAQENLPRNERVLAWRAELAPRLPEYMIPTAFVVMEVFPLTVNGKVDRKALPPPEKDRSAVAASFEAPRNEVEEKVAAIWQQVLGQEAIGIHDDFFELGGHSLLATQVMAQLREVFAVELPLRLLFEKKTIAALADEIVAREVANADDEVLARLLAEL
jgi:amino acid adenylation domain-containing protein